MRILHWILAVAALMLFSGAAQAVALNPTVTTTIDTVTREIRLEIVGLPQDYFSIALQGVMGLEFSVSGSIPNNPHAGMGWDGQFEVGGGTLQLNFRPGADTTTFVVYHYLDTYEYTGTDESAAWIKVGEPTGDLVLTANRPILALTPVPEPSTGLLCLLGLTTMTAARKARRNSGAA